MNDQKARTTARNKIFHYYRVVQKSSLFSFSSQSCVLHFFPHFSGRVDSRHGRFFWHQYGSNWTIYYAAADKNHRGVLCRKISSSDTAAMQERFWQEQCTWWIKRISHACCQHHLKNMEKNCKTQLWDGKQNRALFWTTLYLLF